MFLVSHDVPKGLQSQLVTDKVDEETGDQEMNRDGLN